MPSDRESERRERLELYGMARVRAVDLERTGDRTTACLIDGLLHETDEYLDRVEKTERELAAAQAELAELHEWTSSDERDKLKAELQRYHEELDRSMRETEEANEKLAAAREALGEIETEATKERGRHWEACDEFEELYERLRRIAELAKGH